MVLRRKVQFDPASGRLQFDPDTGKILLYNPIGYSGVGAGCCGEDTTPKRLIVTLTGLQDCDCIASPYSWASGKSIGVAATLNDIPWVVKQVGSGASACTWSGLFGGDFGMEKYWSNTYNCDNPLSFIEYPFNQLLVHVVLDTVAKDLDVYFQLSPVAPGGLHKPFWFSTIYHAGSCEYPDEINDCLNIVGTLNNAHDHCVYANWMQYGGTVTIEEVE